MLMFTLAISCLITSNLPWFMDQVPTEYCSLQHWTLLPSPVTSIPGCFFFLLWLHLLILSGVISSLYSFLCVFHLWGFINIILISCEEFGSCSFSDRKISSTSLGQWAWKCWGSWGKVSFLCQREAWRSCSPLVIGLKQHKPLRVGTGAGGEIQLEPGFFILLAVWGLTGAPQGCLLCRTQISPSLVE